VKKKINAEWTESISKTGTQTQKKEKSREVIKCKTGARLPETTQGAAVNSQERKAKKVGRKKRKEVILNKTISSIANARARKKRKNQIKIEDKKRGERQR
jgi:hypothetical protein